MGVDSGERRALIQAEIARLQALEPEQLAEAKASRPVIGASGREYSVEIEGCDDEEYGPNATVRIHGTGIKRAQRLRATVVADDPELSDEAREALRNPDVKTRSQDVVASTFAILILLALIAPWFIGVGFLISLLF